jgi:HK97 family phage prohead protease
VSEQPPVEMDSKAANRSLNSIGYAAARGAISGGAVSEGAWSFSAADGNALLGEDGDDWRRFGRAHLGVNTDADPESKARFSYPWGKLVSGRLTLFASAVRAIRSRASQQGDTSIYEAAGRLMNALGDGDDGDKALAMAFERAALSDEDRRPTEAMAIEADRGLAWHQRYQRGGVSALDLSRALAIKARAPLPPDSIAYLTDFFAEHGGKPPEGWSPGQRGYPSPARIRWALAGGDAGYRWAVRTGKTARVQKDAGGDGLVHKSALIQERSETGVTFVASDESVDRMGDIIVAGGWKLDSFRRNPQLLFGHLRDRLPVGRVDRVWVESKRLLARASFLPTGVDEFADKVARLVRDGFLNAVSVAFVALKAEPRTDAEGKIAGFRFLEHELVELSIVPVPANANAVAVARSIGFTDTELQRCFADPSEALGVPAPVRLEDHRLRLMRLRRCG